MKLSDALEIIIDLAKENMLDLKDCETKAQKKEYNRQVEALTVVEDLNFDLFKSG